MEGGADSVGSEFYSSVPGNSTGVGGSAEVCKMAKCTRLWADPRKFKHMGASRTYTRLLDPVKDKVTRCLIDNGSKVILVR